MKVSRLVLALSLATLPRPGGATERLPHFDAHIRLDPAEHRLSAEVAVTLQEPRSEVRFELHRSLAVTSPDSAIVVTRVAESPEIAASGGINTAPGEEVAPTATWMLRRTDGAALSTAAITYTGAIHHALASPQEESARSFSTTAGIIDDIGVFLSGSSYWLPHLPDGSFRVDLEVDLPDGWDVVAEGFAVSRERGNGRTHIQLESDGPLEDAHIVAARFTRYERKVGKVLAEVYLREPDPALAAKYLDATARYLPMYATLLGPYPYRKFALAESFWETGYGMPSFTLLGSKVIRFPFILTSSYPHEILHDWWGNGVFVDYESGNWCEGLTAYLADHMFKEEQGQGADYRKDTLKRYADYVGGAKDFPLSDFRARHSPATEAVGYGKSLMLWHMIRRSIGDDAFVKALRAFYQEHRFKRARFADLERAFSAASGQDQKDMFRRWVDRTGAPMLVVDRARTRATADGGHGLELVVRQTQDHYLYALDVPVAITTARGIREEMLHMSDREATLKVALDSPALAVVVDPGFDVFRRLDRDEIAPSLSEIFGADHTTIVLPAKDLRFPAAAWSAIAEAWSKEGDVQVVTDDQLASLPVDRAVWLLGHDNRFASTVPPVLLSYGARVTNTEIDFGGGAPAVAAATHSSVVVVRRAGPGLALGWITADRAEAIPGLARKLPHYGKYSFLAFEGDDPTNVRKGQWPASSSPLVMTFTPGTKLPELAAREPLTRPAAVFDAALLMAHVGRLSDPALEGRAAGSQGAHTAADYVANEMAAIGLAPGGDGGGFFATWHEPGGPGGATLELRNVIGVIPGSRSDWSTQSVVLGAHLDHLGRGWPDVRAGDEGKLHPGADDDASGIAVMLEVARTLVAAKPPRTIVFIAFDGEEWGRKGSKHYVGTPSRWPARQAIGMVALDAVGRLGDRKPLVLAAGSASEWQHIARGIGFTTGVESQLAMSEVGASDHQSFLEIGVPAIQLFAGAHDDYHRPTDTADKIDAAGMVKIATLARETTAYLSDRETPLTSTLGATPGSAAAATTAAPRRASLGTMPDFAFTGPGVRVEKVMPGTPAESAGIAEGDILLAIDDEPLANLKGYSDVLKKHAPGDRVRLKLRRGERELDLNATLGER